MKMQLTVHGFETGEDLAGGIQMDVYLGGRGPKGDAADAYVHTQSVAAATWTINHNLGFKPAVTVYSVGGLQVGAGVAHVSDNQTQISFAAPQAGSARLI